MNTRVMSRAWLKYRREQERQIKLAVVLLRERDEANAAQQARLVELGRDALAFARAKEKVLELTDLLEVERGKTNDVYDAFGATAARKLKERDTRIHTLREQLLDQEDSSGAFIHTLGNSVDRAGAKAAKYLSARDHLRGKLKDLREELEAVRKGNSDGLISEIEAERKKTRLVCEEMEELRGELEAEQQENAGLRRALVKLARYSDGSFRQEG